MRVNAGVIYWRVVAVRKNEEKIDFIEIGKGTRQSCSLLSYCVIKNIDILPVLFILHNDDLKEGIKIRGKLIKEIHFIEDKAGVLVSLRKGLH